VSEILDRVHAYCLSGVGWEKLRDWLASREYPDPERYSRPRDMSDDLAPYTEGTWDEVRRCRNAGLLTQDEYMDVVREADARRAQSPVDAADLAAARGRA